MMFEMATEWKKKSWWFESPFYRSIILLIAVALQSFHFLLLHHFFLRLFLFIYFIIYLLLSLPFMTFPITHDDELELMDLNKEISKRKRSTDREWKMRRRWSEIDNRPLAGVCADLCMCNTHCVYSKWIDRLNAHLKTSYFVKSERF